MSDVLMKRMQDLVFSKDICVLATASAEKPHCSLMAYVADDGCREIYMVTGRNTTKYRNLAANPEVSLLIDTREEHSAANRRNAQALTVEGRFIPIDDEGRKRRIVERFRERHPHIQPILDEPDVEILRVRVRSYLLLDGVSDSHFLKLE